MRRTHQALITLALGLALIGATTAVAAAVMPPAGTKDQADQRKALYQAEQERTLARHRALGALGAQPAQPTIADDSRRPPTEAQVGKSWRHPGNVRARPAEPSGQPGWVVLGLGVLAAALALAGGLAVTTTRRARRRVRVGQRA